MARPQKNIWLTLLVDKTMFYPQLYQHTAASVWGLTCSKVLMFAVARKHVQLRPFTGKSSWFNISDICCLDEKYFVGKEAFILTKGEIK